MDAIISNTPQDIITFVFVAGLITGFATFILTYGVSAAFKIFKSIT